MEAREFWQFMKLLRIGLREARPYVALANMEVRNGHASKAATLLRDGITQGAQPLEQLQTLLQRLGFEEEPQQPATRSAPAAGGSAAVPKASRSALPAQDTDGGTGAPTKEVPAQARRNESAALHVSGIGSLTVTDSVLGSTTTTPQQTPTTTPLRPKMLSYGSGASESAECAAPEGSAASGNNASDGDAAPSRHPLSAAAAAVSATLTSAESTAFTVASENLSPIVEEGLHESILSLQSPMLPADLARTAGGAPAKQPAAAAPDQELSDWSAAAPGDSSGLAENAKDHGGRPPKTIVVNGVGYTQLKTIGRGGSSKVYQVQAPSGEIFALKRVTTGCVMHFDAFTNEVSLLRQLKGCPRVIQMVDTEVSRDKGQIHIVMELGEVDLGRLLTTNPDLTLGDIQGLWRQMLESVQVIHERRIVHSDLKPGNFMLVAGKLKLIDFGIAKRISTETTNISREASVGTLSYMAPEAVKQGAVKLGRASDIWSLGIILYQMVYRRAPFAHLEPMQRLFALSDPEMSVDFPPDHRLENHSAETKAALMDVLSGCLRREARERLTIPELLAHPFLRESARVPRSVFDRAMEALVSGFYTAAREALQEVDENGHSSDGLGTGTSDAAALPHQDVWQALADEVWDRLTAVTDNSDEAVWLRADASSGAPLAAHPGMWPFRRHVQQWVAQGAKRRRTEDAPSQVGRGKAPPMAPPPPRGGPSRPPLVDGSAADRAAAAVSNIEKNSGPGGPGAVRDADLLIQRACLKKVPRPSDRMPRDDCAAAGKENNTQQEENAVLRRLKDRRAMVEDEEEECTQCTRWGASM
eukprot:gnl/TRDRNA2_/TRDRNA2_183045_c0_seq1.p1 gnl/TRDRNA2_/TRDRNA2_183045_c0~~gnl/TRDRNA2_/TRDRNA2_183045_c0_seq1.p1  ORF type:complete len:906 (+),score=188.47 gnl/TRDRNA2_/TRDRNA2_183045_c0_seq1:276-2720(+)